ncbi:conserved hypothetical protein [Sphingomonas sp. EC-HK361]|uniref:PAS domain-containing protein n=1 Tax=Sphingomonas sp. EC-HK361 TaxID=2038397 RepID=UPI001251B9A1|nr:PAS domain-containing protein [Sphingomonas sp. EC-HK361]VVT07431.1 conserved hypothetical protein [Sphingomonas sp. EC-HK361]
MIPHPPVPQSRVPQGHDRANLVTASVLVRQFGVWQERAAHAPVYILHRGRPRLAMLSVEILEALLAPAARDADPQGGASEIIDSVPSPLLLVDDQARITAINGAARALLGARPGNGTTLTALAGTSAGPLASAIQRASSGSLGETAEIASPRDSARTLALTMTPVHDGLLVAITDATLNDDIRTIQAERHAEVEARQAAGRSASARISLRGYVEVPDESLMALTGLAAETLATARFVSLFDVATRVSVGSAMERVIDGSGATGLSATLLVNRGDPLSVRVGLAPIRRGAASIEGVSAAIAHAGDDFRDG